MRSFALWMFEERSRREGNRIPLVRRIFCQMPALTAGMSDVLSAQIYPFNAKRAARSYLASAVIAACCVLTACGSDKVTASQALVTWADEYCEAGLEYLSNSEPLVTAIPDREEPRNMLEIEQRKARALVSLEGANEVLEDYLGALRSIEVPYDARWVMDVIIDRRQRVLEVRREQLPAIRDAADHSDFLLPDLAISIAAADVGYAYVAARQNAPHGSERRIAAAMAEAPACQESPELTNLPWLPPDGFVAP